MNLLESSIIRNKNVSFNVFAKFFGPLTQLLYVRF